MYRAQCKIELESISVHRIHKPCNIRTYPCTKEEISHTQLEMQKTVIIFFYMTTQRIHTTTRTFRFRYESGITSFTGKFFFSNDTNLKFYFLITVKRKMSHTSTKFMLCEYENMLSAKYGYNGGRFFLSQQADCKQEHKNKQNSHTVSPLFLFFFRFQIFYFDYFVLVFYLLSGRQIRFFITKAVLVSLEIERFWWWIFN